MLCTRNTGEVLTPGSSIRPLMDAEDAVQLMKQLYGMEVNTCHMDVNTGHSRSQCDELCSSNCSGTQTDSLLRVRSLGKKILSFFKNVKICSQVTKFSATPIFVPILFCRSIRE